MQGPQAPLARSPLETSTDDLDVPWAGSSRRLLRPRSGGDDPGPDGCRGNEDVAVRRPQRLLPGPQATPGGTARAPASRRSAGRAHSRGRLCHNRIEKPAHVAQPPRLGWSPRKPAGHFVPGHLPKTEMHPARFSTAPSGARAGTIPRTAIGQAFRGGRRVSGIVPGAPGSIGNCQLGIVNCKLSTVNGQLSMGRGRG